MKHVLFILTLTLLSSGFKPKAISDRLCRENEEVVYSFRVAKSGKVASLCKEKNGKYLVYRFGTKDKIELEYPNQLNSSSWKTFQLYGAKRFGGVANAGFIDYRVSFINNKVKYELYEWSSDEDQSKEIGIKVTVNGKESEFKGSYSTKQGSLLRLDDDADKIENRADQE